MREAIILAGIAALGSGLDAQPVGAHNLTPSHHPTHHYQMEPVTARVEVFDAQTGSFSEEPPTDGSLSVREKCSDSTGGQVKLVPYQYSPQSLGKCAVGDKVSISVSSNSGEHFRTQHFTVHKRPIHAVFLERLTGDSSDKTPPNNYATDPGYNDNPPSASNPNIPNIPNNPDPNPEPIPDPKGNPPVGDGSLSRPSFTLSTTYLNTLNQNGIVVATNGTVEVGQEAQWLAVINNDGETAESVDVSDTPPIGEAFGGQVPKEFSDGIPRGATIDPVTGTANWTISNLEPGASATYLTRTLAGPDKPCSSGINKVEATVILDDFEEDANFSGLDLGSNSNDGVVCNPDGSITPPTSMK